MRPRRGVLVGAGGEPSGALICNANGSSPRERGKRDKPVVLLCNPNGSSPRERGKRDGSRCNAVQLQRVIPTPPARLPAGTVDMLHALRVGCQPETLKHSPLSPCSREGEGRKKW